MEFSTKSEQAFDEERYKHILSALHGGSRPILPIEEYLLSSSDSRETGQPFDNPKASDTGVTLGSVLRLEYDSPDREDETVMIVGLIDKLPDELRDGMGLPEDIRFLKIFSPLARRLLGKEVGHYEDGFIHPFTMSEVDNTAFESST